MSKIHGPPIHIRGRTQLHHQEPRLQEIQLQKLSEYLSDFFHDNNRKFFNRFALKILFTEHSAGFSIPGELYVCAPPHNVMGDHCNTQLQLTYDEDSMESKVVTNAIIKVLTNRQRKNLDGLSILFGNHGSGKTTTLKHFPFSKQYRAYLHKRHQFIPSKLGLLCSVENPIYNGFPFSIVSYIRWKDILASPFRLPETTSSHSDVFSLILLYGALTTMSLPHQSQEQLQTLSKRRFSKILQRYKMLDDKHAPSPPITWQEFHERFQGSINLDTLVPVLKSIYGDRPLLILLDDVDAINDYDKKYFLPGLNEYGLMKSTLLKQVQSDLEHLFNAHKDIDCVATSSDLELASQWIGVPTIVQLPALKTTGQTIPKSIWNEWIRFKSPDNEGVSEIKKALFLKSNVMLGNHPSSLQSLANLSNKMRELNSDHNEKNELDQLLNKISTKHDTMTLPFICHLSGLLKSQNISRFPIPMVESIDGLDKLDAMLYFGLRRDDKYIPVRRSYVMHCSDLIKDQYMLMENSRWGKDLRTWYATPKLTVVQFLDILQTFHQTSGLQELLAKGNQRPYIELVREIFNNSISMMTLGVPDEELMCSLAKNALEIALCIPQASNSRKPFGISSSHEDDNVIPGRYNTLAKPLSIRSRDELIEKLRIMRDDQSSMLRPTFNTQNTWDQSLCGVMKCDENHVLLHCFPYKRENSPLITGLNILSDLDLHFSTISPNAYSRVIAGNETREDMKHLMKKMEGLVMISYDLSSGSQKKVSIKGMMKNQCFLKREIAKISNLATLGRCQCLLESKLFEHFLEKHYRTRHHIVDKQHMEKWLSPLLNDLLNITEQTKQP